jgi:hypothetical protein
MPEYYKDIIEFIKPTTMEEVIQMDLHCYEQAKGRYKMKQLWKGKVMAKYDQRNKGIKPPRFRKSYNFIPPILRTQ